MDTRKVLNTFLLVLSILLGLVLPADPVRADGGTQPEHIQGLSITRIAPVRGALGEKIWVVIQIENTSTEKIDFEFIEKLGQAEFDLSQAKATLIFDPGAGLAPGKSTEDDFNLYTYEWKVTLEPGNITYLTYWLIPTHAGEYVISPAQVIIASQRYRTASWVIKITCVMDGVCQAAQGETVLTCPEDCQSGQADAICQAVLDGVIDPDCEDGYDPDAAQPTEPAQPSVPTETALPAEGKVKFNPALCPGAALLIGLTLLLAAFRQPWAWMMHL